MQIRKWQDRFKSVALLWVFPPQRDHRFETNLGSWCLWVFFQRVPRLIKNPWGKRLQHFGSMQRKTFKIKCSSLRNICFPRVSPPHPVVRACNMPNNGTCDPRTWRLEIGTYWIVCSLIAVLCNMASKFFTRWWHGGFKPSKSNLLAIDHLQSLDQANSLRPKH